MRILHTMLRVGDLQRSLTSTRGARHEGAAAQGLPDGKFTLAFVGYGDESKTAVLELTHNWDTTSTRSATATATSRSKWTTPTRPAKRSRSAAAR